MRLLIELPLTIAFFTLAVKYGWPYTIIFVLGYILAFNFKLPYLSRRAQVSTRFLVFLGDLPGLRHDSQHDHRPLLFLSRTARPGLKPTGSETFSW